MRALPFALLTALILVAFVGAAEPAPDEAAPDEAAPDEAAPDEAAFVPLFDGQTLAGWEGNLDWFRVEDGAIVAGTLEKAIPRNEFLCTEAEYGDFELRLKVKLVGGADANAGIQFRTRRIPDNHEVSGYQADMGEGWWGCLYDESRRNRVLAQADAEALLALRPGDWNDYVIRCEGPRIQLWLNGHQTVDYTEEEEGIEQTGVIAVQIHGGGPTEAWYKDVKIKGIED